MEFTGKTWAVGFVKTILGFVNNFTCGFCDLVVIRASQSYRVYAHRPGAQIELSCCEDCFAKYIKPDYSPPASATVDVAA